MEFLTGSPIDFHDATNREALTVVAVNSISLADKFSRYAIEESFHNPL
ncbi:MAG TPA: hypothetical protein VKZ59_11735 [Acidobacteriota bacterium]|nr:hypothetical protein [Acidobacteriota bacterium]